MTDSLNWTEEQWESVRRTVHDQALRARVAASFLPLFGPLPTDTQMVPANVLEYMPDPNGTHDRMAVLDNVSIRLLSLSVNVYLKNAQVADPELTSAMIMFRRAANVIARVEDAIIFNGQGPGDEGPMGGNGLTQTQPIWRVSGGQESSGLLAAGLGNQPKNPNPAPGYDLGQRVFLSVVKAIENIEGAGYHGPFACVMGDGLFTAITAPMPNSMVLPRDSLLPFLDAPLLRSSAIPRNQAVIVSLHGAPVEIVVPNDITVRHLQTTPDALHVFRVQQRFVLRIKDQAAVATVTFDGDEELAGLSAA